MAFPEAGGGFVTDLPATEGIFPPFPRRPAKIALALAGVTIDDDGCGFAGGASKYSRVVFVLNRYAIAKNNPTIWLLDVAKRTNKRAATCPKGFEKTCETAVGGG